MDIVSLLEKKPFLTRSPGDAHLCLSPVSLYRQVRQQMSVAFSKTALSRDQAKSEFFLNSVIANSGVKNANTQLVCSENQCGYLTETQWCV